ncbi:MAG: DUF2937 family protein [Parvibaculaceae bacterium]
MLTRTISLAFGLLGALVGAQLPEIMQQYQQRLGGATDEVAAIIERFDADAIANRLSRTEAVAKLQASTDDLVRRRGSDMETIIERFESLSQQREGMSGGYLARAAYFLTHADGVLLNDTLEDYRPAVPTTAEGIFSALVGFVIGWSIVRFIAWPFQRWREMRRRHA